MRHCLPPLYLWAGSPVDDVSVRCEGRSYKDHDGRDMPVRSASYSTHAIRGGVDR